MSLQARSDIRLYLMLALILLLTPGPDQAEKIDPDLYGQLEYRHIGPQDERGVFRTNDGGQSWEKVLFVDENTGAADLVMDPNNPGILFASYLISINSVTGGVR
jgi:hypothetical protein